MASYPQQEVEAAITRLRDAFVEAEARNDWAWIADELYLEDCLYICPYGGGGKFSSQYDLFDIAHQMRLCDELEDAGLLSPTLKAEWVDPMKDRLITMLERC